MTKNQSNQENKGKICANPACPKAGLAQPYSNFRKLKKTKDGCTYRCKECLKKSEKENYKKNKENIRSTKREQWYKTHPGSKEVSDTLKENRKLSEQGFRICPNPKCESKGEPQPLSNFQKDSRTRDGRKSQCKSCVSKRMKKYSQCPEVKEHRADYSKQRYKEKREDILVQKHEYYLKNKEKIQEYNKSYSYNNKDKARKYRNDNLEFHHLDPTKKDYGIDFRSEFDAVKDELDKTQLVCSNCHASIHAGELL